MALLCVLPSVYGHPDEKNFPVLKDQHDCYAFEYLYKLLKQEGRFGLNIELSMLFAASRNTKDNKFNIPLVSEDEAEDFFCWAPGMLTSVTVKGLTLRIALCKPKVYILKKHKSLWNVPHEHPRCATLCEIGAIEITPQTDEDIGKVTAHCLEGSTVGREL